MYHFNEENDTVDIKASEAQGGVNNVQDQWHFKVDKLLINAVQEKVFQECGEELIKATMEGYNATILAYGQTGAGKTFTIAGGS